ncbi:uncharacterized protein METZ01_LOCUS409643 [marine metagenome]|uniref:Uncharacterized protein n=1 Tax=marine metagenome TaxID=408172 RepID=A0A382WDM1_9ZZZZ
MMTLIILKAWGGQLAHPENLIKVEADSSL